MSLSIVPVQTACLCLWLLLAGLLGFSGTAAAKAGGSASFTGVWRGAGTVSYRGWEEPISCRVKHTNKSDVVYFSNFDCSVKRLGRGKLTILMAQAGPQRYSGAFYDDYNKANVRVSIVQSAGQQKVFIRGKQLSGMLSLRK